MIHPGYSLLGPLGAWLALRMAEAMLEDLDEVRLEALLEGAFGCTVLRKDGRP